MSINPDLAKSNSKLRHEPISHWLTVNCVKVIMQLGIKANHLC